MDFLRFEEKAVATHGDTYDYSSVRISTSKDKVEIICREHGPFMQAPDHHMRGRGCPKCAASSRSPIQVTSLDQFIEEASKAHGNFYDYSSSVLHGLNEKVAITCPVHGEFSTLARKHLREHRGCPSCGQVRRAREVSVSFQEFFDKAVDRHGLRYSYLKTSLSAMSDVTTISCRTHGDFQMSASAHLRGQGCMKCRPRGSSPENELADFIEKLGFDVVRNCRSIIQPLELDVVVPKLKMAFEFNGIFWHSEQAGKKHWYHQQKTQKAKSNGYRLFHVYESDWDNRRSEIQEKIIHMLRPEKCPTLDETFVLPTSRTSLSLVHPEVSAEVCSVEVEDGVVVSYRSLFGVEPIKELMVRAGLTYLKVSLDWPDLPPPEMIRLGFRKDYYVPPERLFFHRKTKERHAVPVVGENYHTLIDSGSVVWKL